MDSTITAVDKPTSLTNPERQADAQPRAGETHAGSGSTADRPARTAENVDSTVKAAVESAIEKFGQEITFGGRSIQFKFDSEINRVIVKVTEMDSGEIVRQIPPEEYLRFVSQFRELLGVVVDETA